MSKKKQKKFMKMYHPVHDRFERFCRARAYGDMPYEDLINESLLVAFNKIDQIKDEKMFLSYIIGISIKILANANRKMRPQRMNGDFAMPNFEDPNDLMKQKHNVELLHYALAKLPQLQREALTMFEITGFSIKEIMKIQSSSESAVKQRLFRGRRDLYNIIKGEFSYEQVTEL